MGMFEMMYLAQQNARLGEALGVARAGQNQADRALDRINQLERRVDRLSLLNLALWQLLQEKSGLTEAELEARVSALDNEDGVVNGRTANSMAHDCPRCHRPISLRHHKCLYCEYEEPVKGFEAVAR